MRGVWMVGACLSLVAALPAAGQGTDAKYGTGRFFYEHCKAVLDKDNSHELYRQGECAGILATMSYFSEQLPKAYRFCSPTDATTGQLAKVFVEYMDKHPDRLDQQATQAAGPAFTTAWPSRR